MGGKDWLVEMQVSRPSSGLRNMYFSQLPK